MTKHHVVTHWHSSREIPSREDIQHLPKEEFTSLIRYLEVLKGAIHARIQTVLEDMHLFVQEDEVTDFEYFVHSIEELGTPCALTFHAQCTEESWQFVQTLLEENMLYLEKEISVMQ